MPHYEITVTVSKPVCVKAKDEDEALEIAEENFLGEWNRVVEVSTEGELDEDDKDDLRAINEYKSTGDYAE